MLCSIAACGRLVRAGGLCAAHYARLKRYGSPTGAPAPRPTICSVAGCGKKLWQHGFCVRHFGRWRRHGDPLAGGVDKAKILPGQQCSVPSCGRPVLQRGYCRAHYMRWYRHGDPLGGKRRRHDREVNKPNRCGQYRCPAGTRLRQRLHYAENTAEYIVRAKAQPLEQKRAAGHRWKTSNPAKVAVHRRRRKTNMKAATPSWLTAEHWAAMDAIYAKARRLTETTGIPHEVDHEVPLDGRTVCGLHVPNNLRAIPQHDNNRRPRIWAG